MKRGARSILGSLSTYGWAAVLVFVATAVVMTLWLSEDRFGADAGDRAGRVFLAASSPWTEATLDDGRRVLVVQRGGELVVAPGEYRVLRMNDTESADGLLVVTPGAHIDVDRAVTPDASAR